MAAAGILTLAGAVVYLSTPGRVRPRVEAPPTPASKLTEASPTPDRKSETAVLSGTVVDFNDRPIQGAQVTVDEAPGMRHAETSSDGVFSINEVPRRYGEMVRLRVVKPGYRPNPYTEDVVLGKAPPRVRLRRER